MVVAGLLVIAGANALSPKLRLAAPLLLVLIGIGVSFLPFVPEFELDPEWILAGVLPPLLYSSSVSMPAMDFRREFRSIGGLSVVLVSVSSVVLGLFFSWVIPDLGLAWGIALGAIVSPTDAVATSIVKRSRVSARVTAVLEGESLLNDATALVILRSAIAGAAASVSLWGVVGDFLLAVVTAGIIGFVVGRGNLLLRARIHDATINTVISFTVPFVAAVPAEELHASGLVAAVVAGLITGHGAPRVLPPRHRLTELQNWRTVELILEGAIFLTMGLELSAVIADVNRDHAGIARAALVAGAGLALTLVVRACYVAPLIVVLRRHAGRGAALKPHITAMQEHLEDSDTFPVGRREDRRTLSPQRAERFRIRLRRTVADIDHFVAEPLGKREGTVVVWAGMRGAVTLAAAQTLPADTPSRALLVFIAFLVAGGSLLLQGSTLAFVVGRVKPAEVDPEAAREEHRELLKLLADAVAGVPLTAGGIGSADRDDRLAVIDAQRKALLEARDDGLYSAAALTSALVNLDADQIAIELRGSSRE